MRTGACKGGRRACFIKKISGVDSPESLKTHTMAACNLGASIEMAKPPLGGHTKSYKVCVSERQRA